MRKIDKLIADFLAEPLKVGDRIMVMGLGLQDKKAWGNSAEVKKIVDGVPYIIEHTSLRAVDVPWKKSIYHIGINPFNEDGRFIRSVNFELESILHVVFGNSERENYEIEGYPIMRCNLNPFVIIDGEKNYFQRDLVWTLEDKQLLIDSIYNNIDCGKVLVRKRDWKELEQMLADGHGGELSFVDLIDGKQRLSAIHEFIQDGFVDSMGNLYSDLSRIAKGRFGSNQLLSYSEISENVDDRFVIEQFLKLNFSGVPQSKEHLEFVRNLIK